MTVQHHIATGVRIAAGGACPGVSSGARPSRRRLWGSPPRAAARYKRCDPRIKQQHIELVARLVVVEWGRLPVDRSRKGQRRDDLQIPSPSAASAQS